MTLLRLLSAAFHRVMQYLRLENGDGNGSLTNVALMAGIYVFVKRADMAGFAGLMAAIAMYQHKKMLAQREIAGDMEVKLAAVQAALDGHSADIEKTNQKLANINTSAAIAGLRR